MLEQQLLEALTKRRELNMNLEKVKKRKKEVKNDNIYLLLSYETICEMQEFIGSYYIKYGELLKEDGDLELLVSKYDGLLEDEQNKALDIYKRISDKRYTLFKNAESGSVINDYCNKYYKLKDLMGDIEKTSDQRELLSLKKQCDDVKNDAEKIRSNYSDLFMYYDILKQTQSLFLKLIENVYIDDNNYFEVVKSRFDYYYDNNMYYNQAITYFEVDTSLSSYMETNLIEYQYDDALNENNELIKRLEASEHEHAYIAVGRFTKGLTNDITLRCAICGEEFTLPLKKVETSYYKNKNGGLLKKKADRIEVLHYLADTDYRKKSNIRPFKVIKKVHK